MNAAQEWYSYDNEVTQAEILANTFNLYDEAIEKYLDKRGLKLGTELNAQQMAELIKGLDFDNENLFAQDEIYMNFTTPQMMQAQIEQAILLKEVPKDYDKDQIHNYFAHRFLDIEIEVLVA